VRAVRGRTVGSAGLADRGERERGGGNGCQQEGEWAAMSSHDDLQQGRRPGVAGL